MPPRRPPITVPGARRPASAVGSTYLQTPTGIATVSSAPDEPPATPAVLPGGDILTGLVHPSIKVLKRIWRVLPIDSFFDVNVSPQSPIQFEIGSYTVPQSMDFWLFDHEASVYRFSGIDPLDWIRAEPGRFNSTISFDLQINGRRAGDLMFELDPHPATLQRSSYEQPIGKGLASLDQFVRAQANSFASASGQGTTTFPPTLERLGPRNGPFCYVCGESQAVSISAVVRRTVTSPIACLEGTVAGYLVPKGLSTKLQEELRPR